MGHSPQSAPAAGFRVPDLWATSPWLLGYSGLRPPVWWYLTELPQGRKAARAGELFQVHGGSSHAPTACAPLLCRVAARHPGLRACALDGSVSEAD